jgi:hypothetical protein
LSGALRRCGMASLAGLSSDHRPCTWRRHIALPILLIGATLIMVPRQSLRRPPALGDRTHWAMAGRRLSPYRSRALPRRKPPPFKNFARPTALARMREASRVLWGDILHVCHERLAQKAMILIAPTLRRGPSMSRLSRTRKDNGRRGALSIPRVSHAAPVREVIQVKHRRIARTTRRSR